MFTRQKSLGLFFTAGVSLQDWLDSGLLDREVKSYKMLLDRKIFNKIYWFTYGKFDSKLSESLKSRAILPRNIKVVSIELPKFLISSWVRHLYGLIFILKKRKEIMKCDILKSNQIGGALPALIAARLFNKPFYLRTGFTLSLASKAAGESILKNFLIYIYERLLFDNADHISVSSIFDKNYVLERYKKIKSISILPNFIDTEKFKRINSKKNNKVVFVGRVSFQKNLKNLIHACNKAKLDLDIIGDGPDRDGLIEYQKKINCKINVTFLGKVSNNALPEILKKYRYFALVSFWEGMPKALMEAMACGLICIGTNVNGINELLKNRVSGFISSDTNSESIAAALDEAKNSNKLLISSQASSFIKKNFSLKKVVHQEAIIFSKIYAE